VGFSASEKFFKNIFFDFELDYLKSVFFVQALTKDETYETEHSMTPYQVEMVLAGSLINLVKQKGLSLEKNNNSRLLNQSEQVCIEKC
jgi:hypothetical protein